MSPWISGVATRSSLFPGPQDHASPFLPPIPLPSLPPDPWGEGSRRRSFLLQVSLAKFSSVNKARKFQQFEILDVAWDENLGGSNLDLLLVEHFASEFQEKHGKDIREHPKVMSKLRKSAKKTKEILSANKAAPIYAEELHDGIDFSSSITRERFEELAAGFFSDAAKPLLKVLERNGLKPSDIANIELLGGGVRVPKLQDSLTAALGGQILSRSSHPLARRPLSHHSLSSAPSSLSHSPS